MTNHVTRRTLLRGMGAALALPWMESLPAFAGAVKKSSKPPVRMCFWYVPNGVHLPTWFPRNEGALVDLPETLRPLSFAREYLNCFHGLTHNTALTNGDSEGCGHGQGSASFLTGAQAYKTQDAVRVDISVDQLYARHVGNETRFPSLDRDHLGRTSDLLATLTRHPKVRGRHDGRVLAPIMYVEAIVEGLLRMPGRAQGEAL